MSTVKKMKSLALDNRGRITIPPRLRKDVEAFAVEQSHDGTLFLIPQKQVSLKDAQLIERLKKSIENAKKGKVSKVPNEWLE